MRVFPGRCWLAILSTWASLAAAEDAVERPLTPDAAEAVTQAVAGELDRQQIVGAAVGIIRNGEVVYLRGFGLADRESQTPATVDTVFNWASNSKPLAAVAVMQLVEQQRLDLDADVRTYVPEFPDHGAVITTRRLLCHQSGIPHYSNGRIVPIPPEHSAPNPLRDPVAGLNRFAASPLLFPPGERVSYSSYAYVLLSAVVQRAGGEPFPNQVQERIAKPLELRSLQFDETTNGQPHWCAGYIKSADGDVVRAPEEAHDWKHGAGGYKSNIADFARWAQALVGRRLLSAETERLMWTPQPLADGKSTSWGLGFTLDTRDGLTVSHNGKQDETTTRMVLRPAEKHGIVVMTNCGYGNTTAIADAVAKALQSP